MIEGRTPNPSCLNENLSLKEELETSYWIRTEVFTLKGKVKRKIFKNEETTFRTLKISKFLKKIRWTKTDSVVIITEYSRGTNQCSNELMSLTFGQPCV